jgi:branched-chain amino acid transport system substrate-binding protein
VYAILALSGPVAAAGNGQAQGLQAAAKAVNAQGGIRGRKVEVTSVDDGADAQKAVTLLQQRLESGTKPDMVWAGSSSNETLAICPILAQNKILGMAETGSSSITPKLCPTEFQVSVLPAPCELASAQALAAKGYKKVAVILGNDALGQAQEAAVKQEFPKAGLTITDIETVDPTSTNVTPQLQKLGSSHPDVLYADGQGAINGFILKGRTQLRWTTPFFGGYGTAVAPLDSMTSPPDLQGVALLSLAIGVKGSLTDSTKVQSAITAIKAQAGSKLVLPFLLYAWAWDSLFVIKEAAAQANSTDVTAMSAKMETWGSTGAPAGAEWISFQNWAFTPDSHFNTNPQQSDFELARAGALDDNGLLSAGS